jgi:hypothetical protein
MGNFKYRNIILLSLFTGLLFSACKDNWADHNAISDPALAVNLLDQINKNPDLSTFSSYLVTTGYDKVVASSKTFTVWAPTNLALQNLDQTIVNDESLLKQFVGNHISNQAYLTRNANPLLTIRALNGKNILFTKTTFEEANITIADQFVGNGVLHVIDLAIVPKLNAWEFLNKSTTSLQKSFILSQNYTFRDLTQAEIIGIDPKTGNPIYKEGTGYFQGNYYLSRTSNISNEDGKYTFILLTDAAFAAEKAKILKYFYIINPLKTPERNAAISDSLANWHITKDMVLVGDHTLGNLPDTLTSYDSLKIHLDPAAIVETHKVSNGVVYVMNRIDYKMSGKMKPVIIEGENYVPFTGVNPAVSYTNTTGTRSILTRKNPYTNTTFREIYFYNHSTSGYWVHYLPTPYAATYKVYWVAVRDFNTTAVAPAVPVMFTQRFTFVTRTLVTLPYKQVDILNYNEVYLGDYTVTSYGPMDAFLVSFTSTTNTLNSLVLDYIKMVPVIN